jgi:hypothetical protein
MTQIEPWLAAAAISCPSATGQTMSASPWITRSGRAQSTREFFSIKVWVREAAGVSEAIEQP